MADPIICPTVLALDSREFRTQIERVAFADRIQIDLMDGDFASPKSVNPIQVWWPDATQADIHLMFRSPAQHLETLVSLSPHLVILHAESDDVQACIEHLNRCGVRTGIALLPETVPSHIPDVIHRVSHVLLFGGHLGSFGGHADLTQLQKVAMVRAIRSDIEISWDGGANSDTIGDIARAGIDVINVGSAIQLADNAESAYATLVAKVG